MTTVPWAIAIFGYIAAILAFFAVLCVLGYFALVIVFFILETGQAWTGNAGNNIRNED